MSALSTSATDNFSNLQSFEGVDLPTPLKRTAGSYGYGLYAYDPINNDGDTVYVSGSVANPAITTSTDWDTLVVSDFTGGANAFGANYYGTNTADNVTAASITIEVLDSNGTDVSYTINPSSDTQGSFLGIISTGTIQIVNATAAFANNTFTFATMDNVIIGTVAAVPEPATLALMLAGLCVLGAGARRRMH